MIRSIYTKIAEIMERHRGWCGTLNNFTEDEYRALITCDIITGCRVAIIAKEVGESGTPHLQMFIEFKSLKTLKQLKELNHRTHWEPRRGTIEEAYKYCKKEGDFLCFGQDPTAALVGQGKRNDISDIRESIMKGDNIRSIIINKCENYQHLQITEKLQKYFERKRNWAMEVFWLYGPPGCGKSRWANDNFPEAYWCGSNYKWWDGYDAHETVIIDDFRDNWCPLTELLTLIDRYPKLIEVKGGMRQLLAKRIIITSCYGPDQCYKGVTDVDNKIEQLTRRITSVINCSDTLIATPLPNSTDQ